MQSTGIIYSRKGYHMLSFKPKPPNCITLITTYRCNAACQECCFGCRADRGRTMTLEEMKHYVDICLETYPESIRYLSLTGGECFLLGDDLDEIVKYGAGKGLPVALLTNGYWGTTYGEALERMTRLKSEGLTSIGFSVGDNHNHIIPLRNSRNAAVASARLGYKVGFRMETPMFEKCNVYEKLKKDAAFMRLVELKKIELTFWGWQEYNNETIHGKMYPWHHRPHEKSRPCEHLFKEIIITPYGDVMACCGIGNSRNPYMRLGNVWNEPIKTVYERSFCDTLKVWIHYEGAQAILQYVYDNSDIKFHKWGNNCEACIELFENPKILPFLREHYDDWCQKVFFF